MKSSPSLVFACAILIMNAVTAEQFKLIDLDDTWQAEAELPGHNYYLAPLKSGVWGPQWEGARVYLRLEVNGKPSDQLLEQWICLWCPRWDREVCTYAPDKDHGAHPVLRFDKDGVYYHEFPALSQWTGAHGKTQQQFDPAEHEVTDVTLQLFGILYDGAGTWRDAEGAYRIKKLRQDHWTSNEELKMHLPFGYKVEIWVVEAGADFEVPESWPGAPREWQAGRRVR